VQLVDWFLESNGFSNPKTHL